MAERNQFDLPKEVVEAFTYGDCGYLALAIHDVTGWPVITVSEEDEPKAWVHVGVLMPSGDVLDVEGIWNPGMWADRWQELHQIDLEAYLQEIDWVRDSIHNVQRIYLDVDPFRYAKSLLAFVPAA